MAYSIWPIAKGKDRRVMEKSHYSLAGAKSYKLSAISQELALKGREVSA
jgi:hypothetical protein